MPTKDLIALVAVGMMLCSRGTYVASVLKGRTKPHAFSWLIWSVISAIGLAAQIAENAGPAAWVRGVGCFSCFAVLGLCFKHGDRRIGRYDRFMLGLALTGIPLWIITKTPVWSVILVCLIDSSGYFLTARKVWRKPRRETPFSYLFSCGGAFLSLLAIANYTPSTWLYPAFLTCSNLTMASYILLRRALTHPRRLRAKKRKTRALASGFPESSELSSLHW
jgi:hypothetical protein